MKKLKYVLSVALIALALYSFIPSKIDSKSKIMGNKMGMMNDLSAEQIATLITKRMTFHLDLSKDQIEKMHILQLELATERKKKMKDMRALLLSEGKPDTNKRFELISARLDKLIETKGKLNEFLSEEQLEEWEEFQSDRLQVRPKNFQGPNFGGKASRFK